MIVTGSQSVSVIRIVTGSIKHRHCHHGAHTHSRKHTLHTHVHTCVHAHTHTHTCTTHAHAHACVHARTRIHTHTHHIKMLVHTYLWCVFTFQSALMMMHFGVHIFLSWCVTCCLASSSSGELTSSGNSDSRSQNTGALVDANTQFTCDADADSESSSHGNCDGTCSIQYIA